MRWCSLVALLPKKIQLIYLKNTNRETMNIDIVSNQSVTCKFVQNILYSAKTGRCGNYVIIIFLFIISFGYSFVKRPKWTIFCAFDTNLESKTHFDWHLKILVCKNFINKSKSLQRIWIITPLVRLHFTDHIGWPSEIIIACILFSCDWNLYTLWLFRSQKYLKNKLKRRKTPLHRV